MPSQLKTTTVGNTSTGRYIQNVDLPEDIADRLFPTAHTPPRLIAAKSKPNEYQVVQLGIYPLLGTPNPADELLTIDVHENLRITTSVTP